MVKSDPRVFPLTDCPQKKIVLNLKKVRRAGGVSQCAPYLTEATRAANVIADQNPTPVSFPTKQ